MTPVGVAAWGYHGGEEEPPQERIGLLSLGKTESHVVTETVKAPA